jgi:hypothetical protein
MLLEDPPPGKSSASTPPLAAGLLARFAGRLQNACWVLADDQPGNSAVLSVEKIVLKFSVKFVSKGPRAFLRAGEEVCVGDSVGFGGRIDSDAESGATKESVLALWKEEAGFVREDSGFMDRGEPWVFVKNSGSGRWGSGRVGRAGRAGRLRAWAGDAVRETHSLVELLAGLLASMERGSGGSELQTEVDMRVTWMLPDMPESEVMLGRLCCSVASICKPV